MLILSIAGIIGTFLPRLSFEETIPMILVTGATGNNGEEIIKLLRGGSAPFRVMVRKVEEIARFERDGVQAVLADFIDETSLASAVQGVDRVFLVTPSTEQVEEQQLRFVRVAVENGVRHVVYLSQLHASSESPVRFLRYHSAVEKALASSGLAWTNLRPNLYMQGLLGFKKTIVEQGKLFAPITDARVSLVDVRNIAAVAVAALTSPGHEGKTYDITGPEALTHAEMADHLSQSLRRKVEFVSVPSQALRKELLAQHVPQWQADGLAEDYEHYSRGEASNLSNVVQLITGGAPISFSNFVTDYRDAFLAA